MERKREKETVWVELENEKLLERRALLCVRRVLRSGEAADERSLLSNVENADGMIALDEETLMDIFGSEMRQIEQTERDAVASDARRYRDQNQSVREPTSARDHLIFL